MKKQYFWFMIFISGLFACNEKYTPKPRGYFRIDFPEKNYHQIENKFPYRFEIPDYSQIQPDPRNPENPYWINIEVPENKAEVHISYYQLEDKNSDKTQLAEFMEESRELAYKHSIKANAISEQVFVNPGGNVYGIVYRIQGNAASPMQFFLTDSIRHFLRGALYIREVPNIDSIQPVIEFLEPDVVRLIETTSWQ
jgi:gliding motility-associated lipoprotein GldD